MNQPPSRERFLRAAVKAGLRLQDQFAARPDGQTELRSTGVASIAKIREAVRRRKTSQRKTS